MIHKMNGKGWVDITAMKGEVVILAIDNESDENVQLFLTPDGGLKLINSLEIAVAKAVKYKMQ